MADHVRQGPVSAFCIDRREVGALDFRKSSCEREEGAYVSLGGSSPATCVTLESATCYCSSAMPSLKKRLPTAEEWLFAAVGESGRKFPWGHTLRDPLKFSQGFSAQPDDSTPPSRPLRSQE